MGFRSIALINQSDPLEKLKRPKMEKKVISTTNRNLSILISLKQSHHYNQLSDTSVSRRPQLPPSTNKSANGASKKRLSPFSSTVINLFLVVILSDAVLSAESPPNGGSVGLNDCSFESDVSRLTCYLKTLQTAIGGGKSPSLISQVENSKIVDINCSEEFLYESLVRRDMFGSSPLLQELALKHCKIKVLPDGAFAGLKNLQKLVIQGYNSEWSNSLKLEVSPGSLRNLNALSQLDLSFNNLWGLPGDLLCPASQNLELLNLTRNNIVEVSEVGLGERSGRTNQDGCQLYNLKVLDLSHNKISSFRPYDLLYAPNIRELRLRGNKLTVLADNALTGLPALVSLDLAENRLAAIPPTIFAPIPALERLFLENNSLAILTAETFAPLDNLLQLNLSANALTSNIMAGDVFYQLTKLVALDLSHNKITSIPDSMFRQQVVLQILNLSHNRISSVAPSSLQALSNLHILLLSYNLLSTLPPTILHSLPSLKSLSLDHNQLIRLPDQLFTASPHLQDLSLNQNRLEHIPAGLDQLISIRTLDLGENRISSFQTADFQNGGQVEKGANSKVFHKLSALYGLRLAGNRLEQIPSQIFQENGNLHVLNLAHNNIANISRDAFQKLNNLRALRLDNNNLSNINGLVGSLKNLKWLNVSENELQWFDFAFIPKSLEWLDVHNNRIDTIGNYYNLGDGFSLKTFDASYNRIEGVSGDNLLHSLHSIYLNNNQMKSVAASSFRELKQLRRVELQDNRLEHLEMAAVELSYTGESPEFLVGGNPWACDCELEWLKNINQLRGTGSYPRILDLDTIMCSASSAIHGGSSFPPKSTADSSDLAPKLTNAEDIATTAIKSNIGGIPLLHMRSDQFVCEYDAHCIPQCYCCDFFACDCRMQCPEGCSCYHDNSWTNNVIQCSNRGHMDVPPLIPMDATAVYLDGNNMTELSNPGFIGRRRVRSVYLNNSMIMRITNYSFEGLTDVRVLHLQDNQIKRLEGNEFNGLSQLQELYLQNNFLTSIAAGTFHSLRDLTVLRLDGNLLTAFPVWELSTDNPLLSIIYLARNTWTCECDFVQPFLQFREAFGGDIVDIGGDGDSPIKCVSDGGHGESLSTMSAVQCVQNSGSSKQDKSGLAKDYQASITSSNGGANGVGGGMDYTPILVSVLLVVLIIVIGYLMAFTFRKTIKSWFSEGKSHRRRNGASGTGLNGGGDGSMMAAHSVNGNGGSVYNNGGTDKLFDVFISYALEDADLVEGNLAATLEHGATSYRLCLHQRDFPPTTPLADTVSVAVETSTRAVIVLSRSYLGNQWVNIRPSFMKAIKDNNTKVVFVLLEELDLSSVSELRQLREDSPCVHWQDQNFWNKLRYFLPEPVYLTFHRSVTMRGTLQNSNLYQPVLSYPGRIELLATKMMSNNSTGHSSLEGDHSTDTTTMTAVTMAGGNGSVYAAAGSEHTYHSIDNNHIYHTLDPGPPSAAANLFHLQFHPASVNQVNSDIILPAQHNNASAHFNAAALPAQNTSTPHLPASTRDLAVHHNRSSGRTITSIAANNRQSAGNIIMPLSNANINNGGQMPSHHLYHPNGNNSNNGGGVNHTPTHSTCSAKRLLSGDDGEYIV